MNKEKKPIYFRLEQSEKGISAEINGNGEQLSNLMFSVFMKDPNIAMIAGVALQGYEQFLLSKPENDKKIITK